MAPCRLLNKSVPFSRDTVERRETSERTAERGWENEEDGWRLGRDPEAEIGDTLSPRLGELPVLPSRFRWPVELDKKELKPAAWKQVPIEGTGIYAAIGAGLI